MKIKSFLRTATFVLLGGALLAVTSCSKEEIENSNTNTKQILTTDDLQFQNSSAKTGDEEIEWRLWRKSRNCFGGLGICSLEKPKPLPLDKSENEPTRDAVITSVNMSDTTVTFYFAQNVSGIPNDDLMFYIDEQLTLNLDSTMLIVPAGSYEYNPNIGEFGGYKISLNLE